MDYVQCIAFSLETGLFFLVQCFWNYLSNTLAKKNFMSSFEFNFFVLWALSSMALFPFLQWYYRENALYREIVPQVAYSSETLITAFLGIRNNIRFKRLISTVRKNNVSTGVINKLNYFRECNNMICIILFFYGSSFFILCVDGLTSQTIAKNKLASDIIISNANVCVAFYYLVFISTFHPRRQFNTNNNNTSTKESSSHEVYKSQGQDVEMDQNRFSQRVTHFVDMHQQQRQASMDQQQQQQLQLQQQAGGNTSQSKLFIRPMSPISVDRQNQQQDQQGHYHYGQDSAVGSGYGNGSYTSSPPLSHQPSYPLYQRQDTPPLHPPPSSTSSPTTNYSTREIAVRDPYSSQPVTFSVIDPQYGSGNGNSASDIPLRGPQQPYNYHPMSDNHSDYSVDHHYIDDTHHPRMG
ncbi:uncharacterized protein BX664DRAFT_63770 [Halteromyces radiatus]|uniref:uncharacterized protein n=1 Tax=Halteromyces radiatus TaxID=101107 RepID=UPI002220AF8D|nr:uncharacterized protein BX664DRAFT_63770 [Halteromyces radiatus]KAI8096665.1 hypothetical protein BX664DRAFT_63770 [Halteromyces radiatus]